MGFCGRGDDSLLFFFLLLVIFFCNCGLFKSGSELLFFFPHIGNIIWWRKSVQRIWVVEG